jgi:transcriptional regulator with XRE-family HTH domain
VTTPPPPPEANLIREKREAMIPRLSMREAARRAGISAPWWRMLETGIRRVKGQDFPERANAETLARMARVVGLTPAELHAAASASETPQDAGRIRDAAEILARLQPDEARTEAERMAHAVPGLSDRQRRLLTEAVEEDIRRIRGGT